MKYLIKSKMSYPNSFIINKERIVFMAFEERVLAVNVAEKYPDHLVLLKVIREGEKPEVKIEMLTEPAPVENVISEKEGKELELITEPNNSFDIAITEDNEDKKELITEPEEFKITPKKRSTKKKK